MKKRSEVRETQGRGTTFAIFIAAAVAFALLWLLIDSNMFSTGVGR